MSVITITSVAVLDPADCAFLHPFRFDITFECISALADDLEWRVAYVGSAESAAHDQVLESILVGPVPVGVNRFTFEAPSPNPALLPPAEYPPGVTVVLLSCAYRGQEFVRIGYYCAVDYYLEPPASEEERVAREAAVLPSPPDWPRLRRSLLKEKPKVTRYPIAWGDGVGADETVMGEEEQKAAAREVAMELEDASMRTNMSVDVGASQMSISM